MERLFYTHSLVDVLYKVTDYAVAKYPTSTVVQ